MLDEIIISFIGTSATAELWGNTMLQYSKALIVFFVLTITFKLIQFFILRRLGKLAQKTKTDIDDTVIKIVRSLRPPFYYFVAFYFATNFLSLSDIAHKITGGILTIWTVYQVIVAIQILIDYILEKRFLGTEEDEGTKAAIRYVSGFVKAILWLLGTLLILSNLGVNVTSLIAGLGIGGIAIAFALQNILGDLFSSFAIYFDKPFQVGDFITVGESAGTVEKIGIKTTRIRSNSGEELVISNQELTSARIKNFKRLKERRSLFTLGVLYDTSPEKLRNIPKIIKDIIESQKDTRFDRVHFKAFADSSLNFEIAFFVLSDDFKEFLNIQQEINLQIVDIFTKEGIGFAYPTQTLYIEK